MKNNTNSSITLTRKRLLDKVVEINNTKYYRILVILENYNLLLKY